MEVTEKQFIEKYEQNVDDLFRHCVFKVSDREVAKDLVQDTFVKVWVYIAGGKDIQNMRALLYKTLSNLIIDYYRKKKTLSLDQLNEFGFDRADDMARISFDQMDGERAVLLLQKLPQEYRDVLFMKYVDGLEMTEIAEIVGDTENTVTVRIHRGIKKLRELYI